MKHNVYVCLESLLHRAKEKINESLSKASSTTDLTLSLENAKLLLQCYEILNGISVTPNEEKKEN